MPTVGILGGVLWVSFFVRWWQCTYNSRRRQALILAVVRIYSGTFRFLTVHLPDRMVRKMHVQCPGESAMVSTTNRPRRTVAKSRKNTPPEGDTPPTRDRIDLRADPAWIARVERQAERRGITVSAYIKQAVSLAVEADEAREPGASSTS